MNKRISYGHLLANLRQRHGWGLREFCRLQGIDPGNWSNIETGKTAPPSKASTMRSQVEVFKFIGYEMRQLIEVVYFYHEERLMRRFELVIVGKL